MDNSVFAIVLLAASLVTALDSSFAMGLDTVAKRLEAAQNGPELDRIVSGPKRSDGRPWRSWLTCFAARVRTL